MHFEMAEEGQLRYLNLNTTYNSTIMLNYRQTELAFWTMYLPSVIGRLVPTYPPFTEVRITQAAVPGSMSLDSMEKLEKKAK